MSAPSDPRQRPRESGTYLAVLAVGGVLTQLVLQLLPSWSLGPLPGVAYVVVAYVIVAAVVWTREPASPRVGGGVAWFLLGYLLLWVYLMLLLVLRAEAISVTALVTPILLIMIWLRPPTAAGALRAGDWLAVSVVIASALSVAAESAGLVESWYGPNGAELIVGEREIYWVPLADLLGLDGRWAGPFVHPNLAGPVGAFVVVFGLTRKRWLRIFLLVGGVTILLLASSRTSWVSVVAGAITLIAVWWVARPSALSRWVRIAIASLPVLLFIAGFVAASPWLGGRASIWPVMTDLWRSAPVLGIGNAGFAQAIDAGLLPGWADHAHNVIFDALVRTGLVGAALVLLVVGIALVITVRAAGRGRGVGLALMVMLLVGSMGDTIIHWRFVTVSTTAMLLAVLISSDDSVGAVRLSGSDPTAPAPPPAPAPAPGSDPAPDRAPTP